MKTRAHAKISDLILWRHNQFDAGVFNIQRGSELLAFQLSVEELPSSDVPDRYRSALTAFRHRRQGERVALCQRFLGEPLGAKRREKGRNETLESAVEKFLNGGWSLVQSGDYQVAETAMDSLRQALDKHRSRA